MFNYTYSFNLSPSSDADPSALSKTADITDKSDEMDTSQVINKSEQSYTSQVTNKSEQSYASYYMPAPHMSNLSDVKAISDGKAIFLNIETTGLSYRNAFVFMAGTAVYNRDSKSLDCKCMLCRNRREEKTLLEELFRILGQYDSVITYAGSIFSGKFLMQRWEMFDDNNDESKNFPEKMTDLQEEIKPCKDILHFENLKKSTVEKALGFIRDNPLSGPELIKIYQEWENEGKDKERDVLIKHNLEDLSSLAYLSSLLTIADFFSGKSFDKTDYNTDGNDCIFKISLKEKISLPLEASNEFCNLKLSGEDALLIVHGMVSRLRYYLPGPVSDYYYLPDEDTAIHKSLGQFVDKSHRKKATQATCYICRQGLFLPAVKGSYPTLFREDHHSDKYYLLYDAENFSKDQRALISYMISLVGTLL